MIHVKDDAAPGARWVPSEDPHTPGAFLRLGDKQLGRVLYCELLRLYSCFVGNPDAERWLGGSGDMAAAQAKFEGAVKTKAADAQEATRMAITRPRPDAAALAPANGDGEDRA